MASQGQRFRRRALRRGYKADEVDTFLDRVEATLNGDSISAPVAAQEVHDVVFRVRFGGYDEWQVDLHLDRVERQLSELEERIGFGGRTDGGRPDGGRPDSRPVPVGDRMGPPPGYDDRMGPPGAFERGGPPMRDDRMMGPPPGYDDRMASGRDDRMMPPGRDDRMMPSGRDDRMMPPGRDDRMPPPPMGGRPPAPQGPPPGYGRYDEPVPDRFDEPTMPGGRFGDAPPSRYDDRGGRFNEPPMAPGRYDEPPAGGPRYEPFEPGRHGKTDMTAEIRMPNDLRAGSGPAGGGPAGPGIGASGEVARIDQLRRTFQPRRFGSGYDPAQVDRLFEGIMSAVSTRGPGAISDAELDPGQFNLVSGGYFEAEVDQALREVRDILRRR